MKQVQNKNKYIIKNNNLFVGDLNIFKLFKFLLHTYSLEKK